MDDPKTDRKVGVQVIAVPQARLMFGYLPQTYAVIAHQFGVLIAVAAMYLPKRCNLTRRCQFNALRAGFTNVDTRQRIEWVRRSGVAAFQLEDRERKVQIGLHIPFCAYFIVREFLRREVFL